MKNSIRVAGFIATSTCDGPGVRSVLFLQGCSSHCKGCQNRELQQYNLGKMMTIDEILELINTKCRNKKITISGGEPLDQLSSLFVLIKKLHDMNFDICLYTGFLLNDVPIEIINMLNYIKVGEYIEELRTITTPFYGSVNQKFIILSGDMK